MTYIRQNFPQMLHNSFSAIGAKIWTINFSGGLL